MERPGHPLVFTLLWSGTMTAIAVLLPRMGRRIFLLITFVPFVIWTEGITPQVSEKYVSTMDIGADDRGSVFAGRRPALLYRQ